jgi:hypothetical protein
MENMPATAELYKSKYCRADNSECARYMVLVALGKENVPFDLFPHEVLRAHEIIDHSKPGNT